MKLLNSGFKLLFFTMLFVIFITGTLSGCSQTEKISNSTGNDIQTVNKTEELKGQIVIWDWAEQWKQVYDEFCKANPGVSYQYVPIESSDYFTKLTTAFASGGDVPDVARMEMGVRGKLISMDVWENLEMAPYNLDRKEMVDFLIPLCTNPKNEIVGIENSMAPSGLAYKRDLAKQYFGVDSPEDMEKIFTSWDAFLEKGMEVKQKSDGKVFMMSSVGDLFSVIANQDSKPYIDGKKIIMKEVLDKPFDLIVKMRDAGIIDMIDMWSPAWISGIGGKSSIFYPCPTWFPFYLIKTNDKEGKGNWGLMTPPGGSFNMGGTLWSIPKAAKNKDLAWALTRWCLFSEEGALITRDKLNLLSAYKAVYNNPDFYNTPDEFFNGQPILKKFAELSQIVKSRSLTQYDDALQQGINNLAVKALSTGMSVQEAANVAIEEVKRTYPDLSE